VRSERRAHGDHRENVAERYNITRERQDAFSAASQHKAGAAIASGRFKEEILPVSIPQRKGDPKVFDADEFPRPETTLEALAKLSSAFKPGGTVTAQRFRHKRRSRRRDGRQR